MESNIEETWTFYRLPREHHKHLKSTNMLERINQELRTSARPTGNSQPWQHEKFNAHQLLRSGLSFRYAERSGLRSAAGARANRNPNLYQDLQTFFRNLSTQLGFRPESTGEP